MRPVRIPILEYVRAASHCVTICTPLRGPKVTTHARPTCECRASEFVAKAVGRAQRAAYGGAGDDLGRQAADLNPVGEGLALVDGDLVSELVAMEGGAHAEDAGLEERWQVRRRATLVCGDVAHLSHLCVW